jgi:3-deoxy-D-manno-octulosonic-acid transferase
MIKPELVLWVKYDFWYYYLTELKIRNISVLLISAVFRDDQVYFRGYGGLWRKMLSCFSMVFVQNKSSEDILRRHLSHIPVSCSGDTRFDRVTAISESRKEIENIREFCKGRKVFVAGSTWEDDEEEMMHYSKNHPEIVFIIAPHLVDAANIAEVKKRFPRAVCYSQLPGTENTAEKNVLIIDNIGMLARLYHYADITYVGGGFGNDGIHNILEAAVYGKPVIIGPVYEKFFEAVELIECGGGFSIQNALELESLLDDLFNDNDKIERAGKASLEYVKNNTGATARIMRHIQEKRLLSN